MKSEKEIPEVSIIVPTVDNLPVLKKCLDHIFKNTPPIYEVVVVADKLSKKTLNYLIKLHLERGVRLLLNSKLMGFSGAVNMGFQVARGKHLALVCSDVFVREGWLEPLLEVLEEPAHGWVSAQLFEPDGAFRPFNISCSLFSRLALDLVGLLDEEYTVGMQDDDLLERFERVGFRPVGVLRSKADHPVAETTMKILHGDKKADLFRKSQEIFYKKYGYLGHDWSKAPYVE